MEAQVVSDNTERQRTVEVFSIKSGKLLIVDQFMLGNPAFYEPIIKAPQDNLEELKRHAASYGACITEVEKGEYFLFRDPEDLIIAALPNKDGLDPSEAQTRYDELVDKIECDAPIGSVFIDTRCVVFCDLELLQDKNFIFQYKEHRQSQKDKQARDLIRSSGGAARYGFNTEGDELGVFQLPEGVFLWPEVFEQDA